MKIQKNFLPNVPKRYKQCWRVKRKRKLSNPPWLVTQWNNWGWFSRGCGWKHWWWPKCCPPPWQWWLRSDWWWSPRPPTQAWPTPCRTGRSRRTSHLKIHSVWKSHKKSHLTLRAKRATFSFWVDKSSSKVPNMVNLTIFLRSNSVTRQVTFYETSNC